MRFASTFSRLAVLGLVLTAAVACSDNGTSPNADETVLLSVVPQGGATGVDPNAPVVMEFSHPMMQGMEEYADVHEGDVDGPLVPGSWSWNDDLTTLTFTPDMPLKPQTRYVIHVGGGLQDEEGQYVNCGQYGLGLGGQWMTEQMAQGGHHGYGGGGMMGGGGMGGGMGGGWSNPTTGTYGMIFMFTTG